MTGGTSWLKSRMLEEDRPFIGTWSVVPDATVADIICSSGIDFIVIDGEHGPANHKSAQEVAIACDSRRVSPMMRCSPVMAEEVLRCLETGVHGLHFPSIRSAASARAAVRMAKYRPQGDRGFSPFTRAGGYSPHESIERRRRSNESQLLVFHIEGIEAVRSLDEILEVEGVDVIFVGLYDLSDSLGIPGQVEDTRVTDTLRDVVGRIRASGKWAGSISNSKSQLELLVDIGVTYVTHSVDCFMLQSAYREIVETSQTLRRRP